ncbi:TsoY family (seleno)protein [Corynebacterium vitaeruminis]|uniref:Uncharacterized protein n=1 Tax=Corynebacterium vitaeruminis DSM 20294 TaxID=1224164 RepID=W5Y3C4_9CORY|nr:hypothetical protein [Corynebacterium vitaeruminis]AHI23374.1 hypothetical protein B843_09945 [Corynebacterium vitaeruminis DSM 20294]
MKNTLGEKYSPLYFLSSLGFGGMSVLFFMNLMHLTPHPKTAIPTFESVSAAWNAGGGLIRTMIAVAYIGIAMFFAIHLVLLAWNLRQLRAWKRTENYQAVVRSNAEVTLLAIPLTLGMTINGLFIVAAIAIPGLWGIVEYLFPAALIGYGLVGVLALVYMGRYMNRVLHNGFDFKANGGLNQLLSAFAFSMVAVGFAAPAAMSHVTATVVAGLMGAAFFGVISGLLFLIFLPMGVMSMLRYGLNLGNSATLWLGVPILTLWAITGLRSRHGLQSIASLTSDTKHPPSSTLVFLLLAVMLMAQLAFLFMGHRAMASNGFYRRFVFTTQEQSPAAFTLVCPGVALGVLSFFFLNVGLMKNGIVAAGSPGFVAVLVAAYAVQAVTIGLMVVLVRNQLLRPGVMLAR